MNKIPETEGEFINPTILSPFKIWTKQNFPFIEDTFEGMDYYGLLCEVVKYLNNVIANLNINEENISYLNENFKTLQSFVDNYFTNLNVQNEINNKLDSMAVSGALDNIFQPYLQNFENSINTQVQSINTQVQSINNKVNSIASGSPAGVYETLEDLKSNNPNHSKIYLVKENNKWYYWNDSLSQWSNGGTYLSNEITKNSVSYDDFVENLQNSFDSTYDDMNFLDYLTRGIYYSKNYLEVIATSNYICGYKIPVNPNDTYLIVNNLPPTIFVPSSLVYGITDSENNNIEMVKTNTSQASYKNIVTIPSNGAYLYVNNYFPNIQVEFYILKIKNYKPSEKVTINDLDEKLTSIFTPEYSDVSNELVDLLTDYYFQGIENPIPQTNYNVKQLNVVPGEKYIINVWKFYGNNPVFITTKDMTHEITANNITYTINNCISVLNNTEINTGDLQFEFTVPDYCNKIYINTHKTHNTKIQKLINYSLNIKDDFSIEKNPLNNKTIAFIGDSITYGAGDRPNPETYSSTGWVSRIRNYNPLATVLGFGAGGTTIAVREGRTDSIVERIQNLYTTNPTLNYIIIQGGVNDCYSNVPLGEMTNSYSNNFDDTTFAGALEKIFYFAQNNWQLQNIGYIVTFKVPSAQSMPDQKFTNYMNLAKEICKKWSVPFIDLFNDSDLNYYIPDIRNNYSQNQDGLHPNGQAYDLISPKINHWLKSL